MFSGGKTDEAKSLLLGEVKFFSGRIGVWDRQKSNSPDVAAFRGGIANTAAFAFVELALRGSLAASHGRNVCFLRNKYTEQKIDSVLVNPHYQNQKNV